MWEFLYRLLARGAADDPRLPRRAAEARCQGNYNIGVTDYTIFRKSIVENVKKTMASTSRS